MSRFLAARRAACRVFVVISLLSLAQPAGAQTWNDSSSRALVNRAVVRRAEQLADTGLRDYQATAHGYVTFLAQLGEGFRTPPKIVKADELELEVYWKAPNQSKQLIVGRRDTLLLPTDIAYHRDHLGIVQNNFPNIIRIGEGDEVHDVPHPLSPAGLLAYDFALTDSFAIGSGTDRIRVYEIKVRPKDDRQPRVVGAVYIDPSAGQVVRMSLTFTRAALLDKALEDLSVTLENRLVGGRFWLPSSQEVEIRRTGTWLEYPVRGIIRGRWVIGAYRFNLSPPPGLFAGPEYIQLPAAQLKAYPWTGAILDSMPPDIRAVTDADVQRVQAEARELVRGAALARAQHVAVSARGISDFARFNRVEGLALGGGLSQQFGAGVAGSVRARYGLDDARVKGFATIGWTHASGLGVHVFGLDDFRDAGYEAERSTAVNSLAAQEFGSDDTDPYRVRGAGAGIDLADAFTFRWRLDGSVERQDSLSIHARPVDGRFEATVPALTRRVFHLAATADRAPSLFAFGTELAVRGELHGEWDLRPTTSATGAMAAVRTARGALSASVERPIGRDRLVTRTAVAGEWSSGFDPAQDLVYAGGATSAPGYTYHSLVFGTAVTEHVEWQMPIPFPAFSLGRFGRVPAAATLAPFVHAVAGGRPSAVYPSIGAGFLTPFNLLRMDVARGVGRGGRWIFYVDLSREFWSIL